MKIVFLTRLYYPHVGGVEKHVQKVSEKLIKLGHEVTIITTKHSPKLKNIKRKGGYTILRFKQPQIKVVGLLATWSWILFHLALLKKSDIVHAHDVAIWLLPLKILTPKKPIYTTMHGWEGTYPIPYKNILLKKLSRKMSTRVIAVGDYVAKYYQVRVDRIIYGAVDKPKILQEKQKQIIFVGRLARDTGIEQFARKLSKFKDYSVHFYGDGPLREFCEAFGEVHGFEKVDKAYEQAEYVFAGGYLTALEALSYGCKVMVGSDNPLKRDYWETFPAKKYFKNPELFRKVAKDYSWDKLTNNYLALWGKI